MKGWYQIKNKKAHMFLPVARSPVCDTEIFESYLYEARKLLEVPEKLKCKRCVRRMTKYMAMLNSKSTTRSAPFNQKQWDLINIALIKLQDDPGYGRFQRLFGAENYNMVYRISRDFGDELRRGGD